MWVQHGAKEFPDSLEVTELLYLMRNLARTLPRLYSHRDNLLGTSQQWRLICSSRLTGQEEALAEAGPEYGSCGLMCHLFPKKQRTGAAAYC